MRIIENDLSRTEVAALVTEYLPGVADHSPPESTHAPDPAVLRAPDVTFSTASDGSKLLGCGARKELVGRHAETESMRTARADLRRGGASR